MKRHAASRWGWVLLLGLPQVADADNRTDETERRNRETPDWLPDESAFSAERALELDLNAPRDGVVVPAIGARWFGEGPGGALAVGLGLGIWQRWTPTLSRADVGVSMLTTYEGYDGAARGRSLRLASRFVVGGGPIHLRMGGDLVTSRHRFDFRPHLDGVLSGGPAVDLTIAHNGYGWVGGGSLEYFFQDARAPQSSRSPAAELSDEMVWYAGLAIDGSVWKYVQQWNAEGPMHLVMSTTLF